MRVARLSTRRPRPKLALVLTWLAVAPALLAACAGPTAPATVIRVGSLAGPEAQAVAEIDAQVLEAAGFAVDRSAIGLGDRATVLAALEAGRIDLAPEYLGSALAFYKPGMETTDADANKLALQAVLERVGGGITVLDYTKGEDVRAFVVRPDTAAALRLERLSDLPATADGLRWGLPPDCATDPTCGPALLSAYGLAPRTVVPLEACSPGMTEALAAGTIDVAVLCSTAPEILDRGWIALADDRRTQAANELAPFVRNDLLKRLDRSRISGTLNAVSVRIDTAALAGLWRAVAVGDVSAHDAAAAWLARNGAPR